MHGAAKYTTSLGRKKSAIQTGLSVIALIGVFIGLTVVLRLIGIATSTVAVIVLIALTVGLGALSIVQLRRRRTTSGAVCGVIALLCLLASIKSMQISKMMSTPMTMPATTVSSTVVEEDNWPPVLSSIGSVSAVQ